MTVFDPTAKRYRAAVKQAADLGISIERGDQDPLMPPRVFALISENALTCRGGHLRAATRGRSPLPCSRT